MTATLEMLVRWSGVPPSNQRFIEIVIPAGTSYEVVDVDAVPVLSTCQRVLRRAGSDANGTRDDGSAILLVPSVVTRMERNALINAESSRVFGNSAAAPRCRCVGLRDCFG